MSALVLYAATHEYISRSTDTPASTAFTGTLQKAFRVDRSVIGDSRLGETLIISLGECTLNNSEGDYDVLSIETVVQGQPITIRQGDRRRPYAEWRLILKGYLTNFQIDRKAVTFQVRDNSYLLDTPTSQNLYTADGSSSRAGTTDLQNKCKPRYFGLLSNVTPPLVNPSTLLYQLNDGAVYLVVAVYVRGVDQAFAGDYAVVEDLESAALSVGEYGSCLAEGFIRIAVAVDTELGEVTCDFYGDASGTGFVSTAADIVRRILSLATALSDPADLDVQSFDYLNLSQGAILGYGVPAGSTETVSQSIANIMSGVGGCGGFIRSGKFKVKRFNPPGFDATTDVPVNVLTRLNLKDVSTIPLLDDLQPPPWRVSIGYNRNWTPNQTNLADIVDDDRRSYLAQEVLYAIAEDDAVRLEFPPGHELIETNYFANLDDAQNEADRKLALYGVPRAMYLLQLCDPLFIYDIGDVVTVDFPRFDLDGGKLLRIVKITEDDHEGIELTVFG